MKPFKCIKQLILQSGIYVLFENQNQTDRVIKL